MEDKKFQPYVPADKVMPEFTAVSILLGALLAIIFGGANAYLGLRVGMTVSASIPAAVISMGVIRKVLRRDSILENNMVQTIGSAGESVAAGAIFTLPALFMWAKEGLCDTPSMITIGLIALCGGLLGVLMMIPLRSALIVKEHGVLGYPEGQACAEVLIAGEEGGAKASTVFSGLGIAAIYKFVADGLKIFPSEITYDIPAYRGSGVGIDVLPALAGVGYICGPKVSSYLFAGGILGWLVIMPLMVLFGGDTIMFPVTDMTINQLVDAKGVSALWDNYLRYIGAGAVACGGVLSLVKSLPLIVRTFKEAMGDYGKGREAGTLRTEQDLPLKLVLLGVLIIAVVMWLLPAIPLNFFTALIVIVFGFFFATVSSRMVGLIGSSNNPVSGMAIATLLISTLLLKATGNDGIQGMIAAIVIGGIICVIAAIAGDTSQDLKTGFLVGAMTMLASNVLFSQGPWTPFQMFAMGIIGFLAGVLFRRGWLRRSRAALCVFGAISAVLIYGGIMNPVSALLYARTLEWKVIAAYYVTGFPMDCVHAAATVFFLLVLAEPMLEKLDRIKIKYGLVE